MWVFGNHTSHCYIPIMSVEYLYIHSTKVKRQQWLRSLRAKCDILHALYVYAYVLVLNVEFKTKSLDGPGACSLGLRQRTPLVSYHMVCTCVSQDNYTIGTYQVSRMYQVHMYPTAELQKSPSRAHYLPKNRYVQLAGPICLFTAVNAHKGNRQCFATLPYHTYHHMRSSCCCRSPALQHRQLVLYLPRP